LDCINQINHIFRILAAPQDHDDVFNTSPEAVKRGTEAVLKPSGASWRSFEKGSMMTADVDPGAPIDLDHLEAQTFGSGDLEREVLRLFLDQSCQCIEKLRQQPDARVAHLLLGSARGIGARDVERAAASLEHSLLKGGSRTETELAALAEAVEVANRFIEARLSR